MMMRFLYGLTKFFKFAKLIQHFKMTRCVKECCLLALTVDVYKYRTDTLQQRLCRKLIVNKHAIFPGPRELAANDQIRLVTLVHFDTALIEDLAELFLLL